VPGASRASFIIPDSGDNFDNIGDARNRKYLPDLLLASTIKNNK